MGRLQEFLGDLQSAGETPETLLGVGFFASRQALPPNPGIEVDVVPPFLKAMLLEQVAQGQISPLAAENIFLGSSPQSSKVKPAIAAGGKFGDTFASDASDQVIEQVSRWLLVGLHPAAFSGQGDEVTGQLLAGELAEAQSLGEAVYALMRKVFTKVFGLRASAVVFLLDAKLISRYFQSLAQWSVRRGQTSALTAFASADADSQMKHVLTEILRWAAEEGLHSRLVFVCQSEADHHSLVVASRALVLQSALCQDLFFRL